MLRRRVKLATTSAKRRVRDLAKDAAASRCFASTDSLEEDLTGTATTTHQKNA